MNRTVLRCFARQHAVIHRAQARSAGLSHGQIAHLLATGAWERVAPNVYRLVGAPPNERAALAAAVLSSGGVASHRSAAVLHGLVDALPSKPELILPSSSCYRGPALVHRTDSLLPRDLTTVDGIRSTNAVRTFVDLGAVLDAHALEQVLHRALHERKATFDRVARRHFQLSGRGRAGSAIVRSVLVAYDPSMAAAESTLEVLILQGMREAGLPTPVRQHEVTVPSGDDYRLDLSYPGPMIAIEGDGFGIHSMRDRFESDRERRNALTLAGWLVLQFTWQQICRRPQWVVAQIAAALAMRR
jgi:very-short-patch-repair endonuclease/predicted transcriptional regulator of viral defense system